MGAGQQQGVSVQLLSEGGSLCSSFPDAVVTPAKAPRGANCCAPAPSACSDLNLANFFAWQKSAKAAATNSKARAASAAPRSVIMVFLQGGPSHIDIWDPKPDAPANIRGEFKPIPTKIPGTHIGETMPMMAKALGQGYAHPLDELHAQRPFQPHRGDLSDADRLSARPRLALRPTGAAQVRADFPTAGSHVSKLKPPTEAVLPFVELPRPLQESGVIGKGGAAGFLGKAYDPYRLYQDPAKPIKTDDLALRKEVPPERLKDRFELLKGINDSMPDLEKALKSYAIDEYYGKAFDLVLSGKARDAFDLDQGIRQGARALRPDHIRPGHAALAPADRGRHALRADELAGGGQRQSRSGFLGHARRQFRPAQESALPQAGPRPLGAAGRHGRSRHAEGDAGGRGRASSAARRASA